MANDHKPEEGTAARSRRQGDPVTRERILDAAQTLFAAQGFAATTTKRIADHAGVATGLVFYYFPRKQELLEALLAERSFAPQLHEILAAADPADPQGTLTTIGERFAATVVGRRELLRIILQTVSVEVPRRGLQQLLSDELDALAGYLRTALGQDRLDAGQALAMARALLSTIAFAALILPINEPIEAFVRDTVDVLLTGYVTAPRTGG